MTEEYDPNDRFVWSDDDVTVVGGKEMKIHFRFKGNARSGNYMHEGRPGKVGGSAPVRHVVKDQYEDHDKLMDAVNHIGDYGKPLQYDIRHSMTILDRAKNTHTYTQLERAMVQKTFDWVYKEDVANAKGQQSTGDAVARQLSLSLDIESTAKPKPVAPPPAFGTGDKYIIAGKTAKDWKDAQAELSAKGRAGLTPELTKAGVSDADAKSYMDRLEEHRAAVMSETFAIASSGRYKLDAGQQRVMVQNLLHHDNDKYEPAIALGYINKAQDKDGFWASVRAHHAAANHHPEYWIQAGTHGKRADRMPYPEAIEMVGDWVATARAKGTPIDAYYKANKWNYVLHPDTRDLAERELQIAVQMYGGKEMRKHVRFSGIKPK